MYHFHTSDQRVQPLHISHIELVLECWQDMGSGSSAILVAVQYKKILQYKKYCTGNTCYTIPISPKNYQIPLMQFFAVCFFI